MKQNRARTVEADRTGPVVVVPAGVDPAAARAAAEIDEAAWVVDRAAAAARADVRISSISSRGGDHMPERAPSRNGSRPGKTIAFSLRKLFSVNSGSVRPPPPAS